MATISGTIHLRIIPKKGWTIESVLEALQNGQAERNGGFPHVILKDGSETKIASIESTEYVAWPKEPIDFVDD